MASAAAAAPAAVAAGASSQSNPDEARVTHADLAIDVDFGARALHCRAVLNVRVERAGAGCVALDTRGLALDAGAATVDGAPAAAAYAGAPHAALGRRLEVALPPGLPEGARVAVGLKWSTSPDAQACQWLAPEQTAGGRHPYLFTQCQAIHARSLLPCQDTPGAKMTYAAAVRVPAALTALMSAVAADGDDGLSAALPPFDGAGAAAAGTRVFRFRQALPVSTYLVALAVGELASRELSPISRVWAEPSVVDAAAYEFAEAPAFLEAAAAVAGPYAWGRYDLLMLPPSFPYGGMENPTLTFVTPTLLAGDRSLASVVAHEVAHSWTGNLVTNAGWSHFWLNEGWTVWLERKIVGRLAGAGAAGLSAALGALALQKAVREQFGPDHPYTRLVPDLSGVDPDDAFSRVPYEKGYALLDYLEGLVGGPAPFEAFFRDAYVPAFRARPLTSEQFAAFFTSHFEAAVPAVKGVDWAAWFYAPGMPPAEGARDDSLARAAFELAAAWHAADVLGLGLAAPPPGRSAADVAGWAPAQLIAFLDKLGELRSLTPLAASTCRVLGGLYGLDGSTNAEVRCSWLLLCVRAGDEAALPAVDAFLRAQGRMKYVRPLFRALAAGAHPGGRLPRGRDLAVELYAAHGRRAYHPICAKMVEADLGLS